MSLREGFKLLEKCIYLESSCKYFRGIVRVRSWINKLGSAVLPYCYGCNTKSTRYSGYSGNVPGLHILLWVELLTPFTSRLPFLLCSSFILTLLIREHRLVVLSFCSIVLRSQTYLRSEFQTPCCPLSGYSACCAP